MWVKVSGKDDNPYMKWKIYIYKVSKSPTSHDIPFIMVIYKSLLNPIKSLFVAGSKPPTRLGDSHTEWANVWCCTEWFRCLGEFHGEKGSSHISSIDTDEDISDISIQQNEIQLDQHLENHAHITIEGFIWEFNGWVYGNILTGKPPMIFIGKSMVSGIGSPQTLKTTWLVTASPQAQLSWTWLDICNILHIHNIFMTYSLHIPPGNWSTNSKKPSNSSPRYPGMRRFASKVALVWSWPKKTFGLSSCHRISFGNKVV